ncbi:alpha-galactosidase [Hungatella effluvii]|uniref:Alpha-galactosidase n=2 Tax=Lachnospiraceae TaxID=186803 RepID=A0A3E3DJR2_9FIRM|nr:alpha-galactosidase [Hungatella effluvii]RGD69530.1 hypothetical protein DWX31_15850 [Hungatella hathewayi]
MRYSMELANWQRRLKERGLRFGLWFGPEMVNKNSDLYPTRPDWILHVPGLLQSLGRNQYVVDFSRE